jgi:hypothetical protein
MRRTRARELDSQEELHRREQEEPHRRGQEEPHRRGQEEQRRRGQEEPHRREQGALACYWDRESAGDRRRREVPGRCECLAEWMPSQLG